MVHGKQLNDVKQFNMDAFAAGRADILVATSVIEVGVDVPNASVMVIESAERFGLSQLHQLRGRVGRGSEKSYCVLMTGHKMSKESKHRIASVYLKLLIFLQAIFIPTCASSIPAFLMMYSATEVK